MSLKPDTVAIPFSSGIKPSSRERLLESKKLLVAQNCSYILDQGPQKRNGHTKKVVRTNAPYPGLNGTELPGPSESRDLYSTADPNLPPTWLYGWGIYGGEFTATTDPFEVSKQPEVGQLFGVGARDSEVMAWDGHRMFSYAPSQTTAFGETQLGSAATTTRGPACMPMMQTQPIAKVADAQVSPDGADNGVLRVVGWISGDGVHAGYSAYDASNGAALVANTQLTFQTPKILRVIPVGPWFHILVADTTANSLEMRSFHQDNPGTLVSRSFGAVDTQFDVKKIDETAFVVIKSKLNSMVAFVLNADGTTKSGFTVAPAISAPNIDSPIACEIDRNGNIGMAWIDAPGVKFCVFNQAGAPVVSPAIVTTVVSDRRLTLSPRMVKKNDIAVYWDLFVEDFVSFGGVFIPQIRSYLVAASAGSSTFTLTALRHRVVLGSHAFRVGNRNFFWGANWISATGGLQTTWFLFDAAVLPVGKMDYGQANPDLGILVRKTCYSVNWHVDSLLHPYKDRIVFHGALPYLQRVAGTALGVQPSGIFTEASIRFFKLDFLPQLRTGQAGRCTYVAGAQLWCYDGAEMVEAGFHVAPEGVTGQTVAASGALSAGTYRYRVDLCHKNAQGEEVRSWSVITSGIVAAAGDQITLKIPQVPVTRREDSYFLIFRTVANGTVYLLANSRNPVGAPFVLNNPATPTFTYADQLADNLLIQREYHPANSAGNYLDPLPAPPCELVASGRDRLWLGGGNLAPGEVAPSRLFQPGETPSFSPALNIQVDRNAEPITAIGFVGDIAAVFRRTSTYVIDSDGPDNSLNGAWAQPRLAVADTGAVGPEGLALTVVGLWFQSPAGLRLLGNSGTMDPQAGGDVDPITIGGRYSAAVVVPQSTQVRWYSRDADQPSVVVDYSSNSWSTWTGLTNIGAVFWPVSNLAVMAIPQGSVLTEAPNTYTDGGTPFEMITRTAWLHGGDLGDFQRWRRYALFGKAAAPLALRIRLFYDERPFWDEQLVVNYPRPDLSSEPNSTIQTQVFNTSSFGVNSVFGGQGAGNGTPFGDESDVVASGLESNSLWFRDGVFKFRRRPARQKCSVFSIEFSDQGVVGAGFEPVVLGLELMRKTGLDRIPTPGWSVDQGGVGGVASGIGT